MNKEQVNCYDKFNQLLKEGDYVDVQKDGVHQIYKKDDGQLYFKPYGEEDRVSAYFSNDIAKCDANGKWLNNDRYEDIPDTLEEAFNRISKSIDYSEFDLASFKLGAKFQQEKIDRYNKKMEKEREENREFLKLHNQQDENKYSEKELKLWLIHRDVYLYNYYMTYIKSGLPLQSVEDFIKESHEYLMDREQ
jgi:hypothetical protein